MFRVCLMCPTCHHPPCKKHDMIICRPNLSPNSTEATRTTDVVCGLFCIMFDCDITVTSMPGAVDLRKVAIWCWTVWLEDVVAWKVSRFQCARKPKFSHKELHRRPFCMAENHNNTCCFLESGAWALHPPKCILVMKYHQRLEMMGGGAKRNQRQRVWKGRIVQRCQNRVQSQKSKAEKDWGALPWA